MACRYALLGGCQRGRHTEGDRVLRGPVRLGRPARRAGGRRLLHRSQGRPDRRGHRPQDGSRPKFRGACREQVPAAWGTYFQVADVDAAVAKVTELGGREVQPVRDSPYGRIGVVADNHGAVFSLITPPAG
ncbi:MAG TPA: VOC family protein [Streptosporangiaceae bacterium]